MNISIGQILIIVFLFTTSISCAITYLCSSSALKTLETTKSFPKAINKIRIYDKYILSVLTLFSSAMYVILSYLYFLELYKVSDYFIPLSILLGFVFSVFTTFFSRLCYCYACNVLLKTKLNELECFKENFLYLIRMFFPIFLISFALPTINILAVSEAVKKVIIVLFLTVYLITWIITIPYKTTLSLNAKEIKNNRLKRILDHLFKDNEVNNYKLYYWDSSKSNEANCFISGIFKYNLFVSSTLIETLSKKELEAVVLHELGHVKNHHFKKLFFWKLIILVFVSVILYYTLSMKSNIWVIIGLAIALFMTMGANLKGSRKYENEADLYVHSKGYGLELISALKKISYEDVTINNVDELFSSHPDVIKRVEKLSERELKVTCVAFNRENSSSNILLNSLSNPCYESIYIRNTIAGSIMDFDDQYNKKSDYTIILAISKELKDEIRLNKVAIGEKEITTSINVEGLKNKIMNEKFKITIKEKGDRGTENDVYYHALTKSRRTILIHIPAMNKISDFELLISLIDNLF